MESAAEKKVLEAQLQAQTSEASALQQQTEQMELKIAALSDAATEKRREAQLAYRAKHAKHFVDIDPAKALSGLPAIHAAKVFDVSYMLRVPNGDHQRQVASFALDPTVKEGDKTIDLGPVTMQEQILLAWLASIVMKGTTKDISTTPPAARLKMLRTLPPVVIGTLASECQLLETYLSVVLDLELGNFSPTP